MSTISPPALNSMHFYRELRITSRALDESKIIHFVETFARSTPGWSYPEEKSQEYAALCGVPSCCLIHEPGVLPKAALHLTLHKSEHSANGVYVPNIIPLDRNSLTKDEYNAIAQRFAQKLRLRARQEDISIQVLLSKSKLGLRDIIGSKIAWRLFQCHISLFPESSHPNDLARLDTFTCALSRYSRRRFDLESFELLLREELGWSGPMASKCRTRVEIGLEVLAASREFHSR